MIASFKIFPVPCRLMLYSLDTDNIIKQATEETWNLETGF